MKAKDNFDYIYDFFEGFAHVKLNDKWNFIDRDGKLLSPNQWFDDVSNFFEGVAMVMLNGMFNFIDRTGKILSPNLWFDEAGFNGCILNVRLNDKWYKLNKEGILLNHKTKEPIKEINNYESK